MAMPILPHEAKAL